MLKVRYRSGIFYLSGHLSECGDVFERILLEGGSFIRLNLREIALVNSIGLNAFMRFVMTLGGRVELHECSPPVVDAINMFPQYLGGADPARRIKSVMVPYRCLSCSNSQAVTVDLTNVAVEGDQVIAPAQACPKCGVGMRLEEPAQDFFFFLTADNVA